MGVRRAMEMALAEANKGNARFFTFGPLIHNRQVLELLESKGVRSVVDISSLDKGTILIRAHGIPPEQRKQLKNSGLRLLDGTCPRVAKVQAIIRYHTKKGYTPVIIGEKDHAEVIGLVGYGLGQAKVINHPSDVENLPDMEKICVVAQTTQDERIFSEMTGRIIERFPDALIFNTICDETHSRQDEVRSLARHVDGMVVVGGYHSGNTRRLAQISRDAGIPTFHVETEKELDKEKFSYMGVVGIIAGASTPNWMITNVVKKMENIRSRKDIFIGRLIKHTLKFLLLSNLLVAMGAFSLSYAITVLTGSRGKVIFPLLAFFYVYAMYVLNRFLERGASAYNDPERGGFHKKHRFFQILTGIAATIGALIFSYHMGMAVYSAMAGLCILGIIYSFPIVPFSRKYLWKYSRIKDIPGSKTFSESFAWASVIVLLPLLKYGWAEWAASVVSFYFVLSISYVRSAFLDILQMQGDMIVGAETLPIVLGEKRTIRLLKMIIVSTALLLLISPVLNLVSPFAFLLLLCLIPLAICLQIYDENRIYQGPRIEYLAEGGFILAGIMALIWQGVT